MKKIILCEGKYDGFFVSYLLEKLTYSQTEYKIFDMQKVDKKKTEEETLIIKNFVRGKIDYGCPKILVKAECGKQYAMKVFCREFTTFVNEMDDIILILDTDSSGFPETIDWIKKFFLKKYGSNDFVISIEKLEEEEKMHYSKMIFSISGSQKGFIHLVLINSSLEDVCEITNSCDTKTKIEKIKSFVEGENSTFKFFPCLRK